MMKILTFYGTETRLDKALKVFLQKRKYFCTRANCFDEIDQLGKQRNAVFLIFNDYEKAISTIKELTMPEFKVNSLLFVHSELRLSEEQKKELDVYGIPVFNDNQLKLFINHIEKILSKKDEGDELQDLQFTAQKKIG